VEGIQVKLNHEKIHAQDCEECDTQEGKLDQITKTIFLRGELTQEQKERLLEIAERCPVNKTLTTECRVRGKLG
jgi:putative redox protein